MTLTNSEPNGARKGTRPRPASAEIDQDDTDDERGVTRGYAPRRDRFSASLGVGTPPDTDEQ